MTIYGDLGFVIAALPPIAVVFDVQTLAAYVLVEQLRGIFGVEGGLNVVRSGLSFVPKRSRIPAPYVLGYDGPLGTCRCLAFHFDDLSHAGPEGGDLAGGRDRGDCWVSRLRQSEGFRVLHCWNMRRWREDVEEVAATTAAHSSSHFARENGRT